LNDERSEWATASAICVLGGEFQRPDHECRFASQANCHQ
jgi:hypothetical protein